MASETQTETIALLSEVLQYVLDRLGELQKLVDPCEEQAGEQQP